MREGGGGGGGRGGGWKSLSFLRHLITNTLQYHAITYNKQVESWLFVS